MWLHLWKWFYRLVFFRTLLSVTAMATRLSLLLSQKTKPRTDLPYFHVSLNKCNLFWPTKTNFIQASRQNMQLAQSAGNLGTRLKKVQTAEEMRFCSVYWLLVHVRLSKKPHVSRPRPLNFLAPPLFFYQLFFMSNVFMSKSQQESLVKPIATVYTPK